MRSLCSLTQDILYCRRQYKMEAGGFEPPSRDISGWASTCLVVYLKFARAAAKRQAYAFAISRLNSPFASRTPASAIPLCDAPDRPAGKSPPGRAAQFRQPFATVCCQVKLSCRIFSQANRHPGHATRPSTCPVEAIRPLFAFSKSHPRYTYIVRSIGQVCKREKYKKAATLY